MQTLKFKIAIPIRQRNLDKKSSERKRTMAVVGRKEGRKKERKKERKEGRKERCTPLVDVFKLFGGNLDYPKIKKLI